MRYSALSASFPSLKQKRSTSLPPSSVERYQAHVLPAGSARTALLEGLLDEALARGQLAADLVLGVADLGLREDLRVDEGLVATSTTLETPNRSAAANPIPTTSATPQPIRHPLR